MFPNASDVEVVEKRKGHFMTLTEIIVRLIRFIFGRSAKLVIFLQKCTNFVHTKRMGFVKTEECVNVVQKYTS